MQADVVRLGMARMVAELLLGFLLAAALTQGRLAGAVVLLAAIAGLGAGLRVSLIKARRPQRGAHLVLIGAVLSLASLRAEALLGPAGSSPTGASLAPAALLGGAALVDLLRERAMRVKEPLRADPMSVLALLGGAAMGAVLGPWPVARLSALGLALAATSSALALAATFVGGPGRPIAKPFDAAVFLGSGALAALLLS